MTKEKTLAYLFYSGICRYQKADERDRTTTEMTCKILLENGFKVKEIVDVLKELAELKTVSKKDLPKRLWKNSLIDKDKFYYHNQLIMVPRDMFDPETGEEIHQKFYLMNKIMYTMDDLLVYFRKRCSIDMSLWDDKMFRGQMTAMLKKSLRNGIVEPLDLLLAMIDNIASFNIEITEPFEVSGYINTGDGFMSNKIYTLKCLKKHVTEQKAHGYGREIYG